MQVFFFKSVSILTAAQNQINLRLFLIYEYFLNTKKKMEIEHRGHKFKS